jgi:hypothetical protein
MNTTTARYEILKDAIVAGPGFRPRAISEVGAPVIREISSIRYAGRLHMKAGSLVSTKHL